MKLLTLNEYEHKYQNKIVEARNVLEKNNICFSFKDICDNILPGEIVVIGGRPGMGKTRFLFNLLVQNALNKNEKVLLMSLKTKTEICYVRIRKILSFKKAEEKGENILINSKRIKNSKKLLKYLKKSIKKYNPKTIYIDNLSSLSIIHDLFSETKRAYKDSFPSFYEYEFAELFNYMKNASKKNSLSFIITDELFKNFEFECGIIKPSLKDLLIPRIELFAHKIFLLNSQYYYGITEDEHGNSTKDILEVSLAKNSNGLLIKDIKLNTAYDIIS